MRHAKVVQSGASLGSVRPAMTRRAKPLLPALLLAATAGCATGYAQDWFRQRSTIITPQLLRYGLDLPQSRCVAERLGRRISRQDMRRLQERAIRVQPSGPAPLTFANLRAVATAAGGRAVEGELTSSAEACHVRVETAATAPVAAPVGAEIGVAEPPTTEANASGTASEEATGEAGAAERPLGQGVEAMASAMSSPAYPPTISAVPAAWLNLGAAASGQSIAIDAGSIQQQDDTRTAWFRMTDVTTGARTGNAYRLRIDCSARTVQPLAMRQVDDQGIVVQLREYQPGEPDTAPGPAESGTVLEIAFLSMCT